MEQEKTENRQEQYQMHKEFFDRCKSAIEQGFYMEAILMEYAAIEARMEILLGLLDLPCNKFAADDVRKKVQISHRLSCASVFRKEMAVFEGTKLPRSFFDKASAWTKKRDEYIHALYKNEVKYKSRMKDAKAIAEKGLKYCKDLYNEVNRLKRLCKKSPELFKSNSSEAKCKANKCNLF